MKINHPDNAAAAGVVSVHLVVVHGEHPVHAVAAGVVGVHRYTTRWLSLNASSSGVRIHPNCSVTTESDKTMSSREQRMLPSTRPRRPVSVCQ